MVVCWAWASGFKSAKFVPAHKWLLCEEKALTRISRQCLSGPYNASLISAQNVFHSSFLWRGYMRSFALWAHGMGEISSTWHHQHNLRQFWLPMLIFVSSTLLFFPFLSPTTVKNFKSKIGCLPPHKLKELEKEERVAIPYWYCRYHSPTCIIKSTKAHYQDKTTK